MSEQAAKLAGEILAVLCDEIPAFDAYERSEILGFEATVARIIAPHLRSGPPPGEDGCEHADQGETMDAPAPMMLP